MTEDQWIALLTMAGVLAIGLGVPFLFAWKDGDLKRR